MNIPADICFGKDDTHIIWCQDFEHLPRVGEYITFKVEYEFREDYGSLQNKLFKVTRIVHQLRQWNRNTNTNQQYVKVFVEEVNG